MSITLPHSSLVATIFPVFKFRLSRYCLLSEPKFSGVNVSSNPSTLYETTPLIGAFTYSAPEFNSDSYFFLSSINCLKYEPFGLDSPAIFAFLLSNYLFLFCILLISIHL